MKVTVQDTETLLAIQPREVAAYLRARGWQEVRRIGEKGAIWIRPDQGYASPEILLPLDRSLRDFAARMADLLWTLEREERRSQPDIIKDIQNITGDLIRVRLVHADTNAGTLPLEAGVKLLEGVREMLMAAALATVSPKVYFQARRPALVAEYMQKVRLGQTEQGSYVVTILSKVPPALTTGQMKLPIGPAEDPFERKVTTTLATSLGKVREAADHAASIGGIDAFEQAIRFGVSANLCEAIATIGKDPSFNQVDITFSWATGRPPVQHLPGCISFSADIMPIIGEAGRLLRETSPIEDVEVRGVVTSLHRDQTNVHGEIIILGVADGQVRRVHVHLPEREYQTALKAHSERLPVVCYGDLAKAGKSWVLRSPRGFRIDTEPDEEA